MSSLSQGIMLLLSIVSGVAIWRIIRHCRSRAEIRRSVIGFSNSFNMVSLRVTPDDEQSRNLERRIQELSYRPKNGFHRDRVQNRIQPLRK